MMNEKLENKDRITPDSTPESPGNDARSATPVDDVDYPALAEKYRIVKKIGHGAQGKVYQAWDLESHRLVAVKVFDFTRIEGWKEEELLRREVAVLKSLDSPMR